MLNELGITYPQYLVLMVLWERDCQPVNDIAHRLLLETNTVTPLLQRMEKEGLVIRTRGIADGRQTLVSLTKKGLHLEEQAKEVPMCLARSWQNEPVDMDEMQRFVAMLDTMIATLKEPTAGR